VNEPKNFPIFHSPCRVCGKEEWQWCGYVKDKDDKEMCFCETCKDKWVTFAERYGVKFGWLGMGSSKTKRHNACPKNASDETIKRLWGIFVKRKIYNNPNPEKEQVQFT
jgi:hypothetical protein